MATHYLNYFSVSLYFFSTSRCFDYLSEALRGVSQLSFSTFSQRRLSRLLLDKEIDYPDISRRQLHHMYLFYQGFDGHSKRHRICPSRRQDTDQIKRHLIYHLFLFLSISTFFTFYLIATTGSDPDASSVDPTRYHVPSLHPPRSGSTGKIGTSASRSRFCSRG
jgi:hypothetical protein